MKGAVKESTVKNTNGNSRESAVDLQEQIRRRAYELYERRGGEDGRETEDWLQAEAVLVGERTINLTGAAVKKIAKRRSTGKANAKQVKKSRLSARSKPEEERNGY